MSDDVRLRRATRDDVDFMRELALHDDVRPFLAASATFDREAFVEELERQEREPEAFGRLVIELASRRAGTVGFRRVNERSRIARVERLAVDPDLRGRRVGEAAARLVQRHLIFDLGFHRLELEIYGHNERAQRHAERAGWIREGVKRQAYRVDDGWVDGVFYALVREDLEQRLLEEHVERFNDGARSGDFAPMLEGFGDDALLEFDGVPVGPFAGRDAIARAYRDRPPDDELNVLDVRHGDPLVAGYAWRREPRRRAGEMRLTFSGEGISRLVVAFAS